jgi:hypothetical protein
MAKYLRFAIFVGCFLYGGSAFAVGGACPSGASYIVPATGVAATLSALGVTNCYFVAASGSDSNSGTDEAHPWQHAPQMTTCTATCATVTPAAGTGIIFRGGDTWHFGNSSASPYTGGSWSAPYSQPSWGGTSSNPVYFGVDTTWFTGSSWARPIFNGDNPASTNGVGSCAFQAAYTGPSRGGSRGNQQAVNTFLVWDWSQYTIVDDIEWTGLCWGGVPPNADDSYISNSSSNDNHNALTRNYFHGWTHVTFACTLVGGMPSGQCGNGVAIGGSSLSNIIGTTIAYNVIDGSDSDPFSFGGINFDGYDVHGNVFTNFANAVVTNDTHALHDNLFDSIRGRSDNVAHGNIFEANVAPASNNVFYNNVFRNSFGYPATTGCGNIQFQEAPANGATDYVFGNVIYNFPCGVGNYLDICDASSCTTNPASTSWTVQEFNNTFVMTIGPVGLGNVSAGGLVNWTNNHCIIPGGGASTACYAVNVGAKVTPITNVVQDTTAASNQGFTSSEIYAYSPASNTVATIGTGTNEQSYCNAMLGSGDPILVQAGTACQSDTGYACVYNVSTHSVSCPSRTLVPRPASSAWNVGAYQLSGVNVNPATSLQGTSH